jgi:hypothetical protein
MKDQKKKVYSEHLKGAVNSIIGSEENWDLKHRWCQKGKYEGEVNGVYGLYKTCLVHGDIFFKAKAGRIVINNESPRILGVDGNPLTGGAL